MALYTFHGLLLLLLYLSGCNEYRGPIVIHASQVNMSGSRNTSVAHYLQKGDPSSLRVSKSYTDHRIIKLRCHFLVIVTFRRNSGHQTSCYQTTFGPTLHGFISTNTSSTSKYQIIGRQDRSPIYSYSHGSNSGGARMVGWIDHLTARLVHP